MIDCPAHGIDVSSNIVNAFELSATDEDVIGVPSDARARPWIDSEQQSDVRRMTVMSRTSTGDGEVHALRIDGSGVSCSTISSNLFMCSEPDSILTQWSIGVEMIEWDPLRAKTLDQQSSKLEIRGPDCHSDHGHPCAPVFKEPRRTQCWLERNRDILKTRWRIHHHVASEYERELRHVLMGTPEGVRKVTRSCTEQERTRASAVIQRPFLVVRAAGSGIDGHGDLFALRGDLSFPIEVKTRKAPELYLTGRNRTQYEALEAVGERCGLMPLYAFRLKGVRGDSWRMFRVPTSNINGLLRLLERRIPEVPRTRHGNPMLRWEDGMPLNRFLGLVCRPAPGNEGRLNHLLERAEDEASGLIGKGSPPSPRGPPGESLTKERMPSTTGARS